MAEETAPVLAGASGARFIVGDSLTVLRTLPDASVDLVLTSPPFLALRSYLSPDDPSKAKEIGQESGPGAFVDALLDVVEECRRVLAPHGSLCFELGDTYSGSGGAGGDYNEGGLRDGQPTFSARKLHRTDAGFADGNGNGGLRPNRNGRRVRALDEAAGILAARSRPGPEGRDNVDGWPLDKSLCLVAEIFRFALVYGFNPLTGRQTPRWRARNVIRWCRPNPPVGALGDKVRPATSDMVVAAMSRRRYFDLDAVKAPLADSPGNRYVRKVSAGDLDGRENAAIGIDRYANKITTPYDPAASAGAPPLDHWWFDDTFDQDAWLISTSPYKGSHYATWPPELLEKPIEAMCPHRVCRTCGVPTTRIVDVAPSPHTGQPGVAERRRNGRSKGPLGLGATGIAHGDEVRQATTIGWTDCGHDDYRPGVVLDPFAGSGTTLAVAIGHGRAAIGIDLDERNAFLAEQRVGMFLTVEHHDGLPAEPEFHDGNPEDFALTRATTDRAPAMPGQEGGEA